MPVYPLAMRRAAWIATLIAAAASCNLITGADSITLEDDDSGQNGSGASSGQLTGSGAGQAGGAGGMAPVVPMNHAEGVTIDLINIYQGVSRPLMEGGSAAQSDVAVVANRQALLRVFYTLDASYNGQPVTARLTIDEGAPLEEQVTLSGSSSEGSLGSTINFDVPAAMLTAGSTFRVDLMHPVEQVENDNPGARYPSDAEARASLEVRESGIVRLTLVPVRYDADGSQRLPDTSAGQVAGYEDAFMRIYPIEGIEVSVRSSPLIWDNGMSSDGGGWESLLDAVAELRNNDGAAFDEYYYGIVEPASSLGAYCGGGCVAGLGFVGGPSDDWSHSAIGIGYSGDASIGTAVHELGHNHGRQHAPCGGAGGPDPEYPYPSGTIGVYGYDIGSGQLISPSEAVDLMSYCDPAWISDYNFAAIFERVEFVNSAAVQWHQGRYERVRLAADGSASWLSAVDMQRAPIGEGIEVTVHTASGATEATGHFYRYDHLDGGVLLVPAAAGAPSLAASPIKRIQARVAGRIVDVSR
jgi:hypothetical protein